MTFLLYHNDVELGVARPGLKPDGDGLCSQTGSIFPIGRKTCISRQGLALEQENRLGGARLCKSVACIASALPTWIHQVCVASD